MAGSGTVLLGFLEPETAARYPDPAMQVTLDLSQVSYVATANSLDPLPAPLRDRFRIITFPKPSVDDLEALLPAVLTDLAAESGVDQRWIEPLERKRSATLSPRAGAVVRSAGCAVSSRSWYVRATSSPSTTELR